MNISLAPETLTFFGSLPITNTLIVTLFLSLLIMGISFFSRNKIFLIPKKFQNSIEILIELLFNLVNDVMQNRELTKRTFPLIVTIFIFVWSVNLVELLPGLGTVGLLKVAHGEEEIIPFLRSSSADMNVTLALALIAVFSAQFFGISALGVAQYAKKFFISPFQKPYGVGMFVGILELVGEFSKIISFSFRLFGNIFAGEVLLIILLMLAPYFIPIPFLLMELFVGFIQALVFAMLTMVFIKMATLKGEH